MFEGTFLLYFLTLNSLYLLFAVIAFFRAPAASAPMDRPRSRRRRPLTGHPDNFADRAGVQRTGDHRSKPPVAAAAELSRVRSRGGQRWIDRWHAATASHAFDLVRADVPHERMLDTQAVRGVYRSLTHRELLVIDKVERRQGRRDQRRHQRRQASARLRHRRRLAARGTRPDAGGSAVLEDPTTVAAGGIIRIANGCRVEDGRVVSVALPSSHLACFQVTEYLRGFLIGRVAQSVMNGLLIISGAFGLFRRDALIAVGGFSTDTVGEDMEVVVRMHRLFRERGEQYRIVFRPDPVCWTEVPERLDTLARQRNRWQRGTLQTLSRHRRMMLNPRYGVVGMCAMPYFLIFEALAPMVEAVGYLVTVAALAFGLLDWRFAELLFLAAVVYGALISVSGGDPGRGVVPEISRLLDLLRLAMYGVLENFGYRQLTMWWRLRGTFDFFRGRAEWGTDDETRIHARESPTMTPDLLSALGVAPLPPVLVLLLRLRCACSRRRRPRAGCGARSPTSSTSAREAATAGRRPEALAALESHLAERLATWTRGSCTVRSCRGKDATTRPAQALEQVLAQAPAYTDARVALMNVAWWSGHSTRRVTPRTPSSRKTRESAGPRRPRPAGRGEPPVVGGIHAMRTIRSATAASVWHEAAASLYQADSARLGHSPCHARPGVSASTIAWSRSSSTRVSGREPTRLSVSALLAGVDSLSVLPRRIRSVPVGRRGLRGVRRVSTARVRQRDDHLRGHRQQVSSGTGCSPARSSMLQARGSSVRPRTTADSADTSGAMASAMSG